MKTGEEKHDLAVNYVEETFPNKVEGTFEKHQMANAFCNGFNTGYDEGLMDGQGDLPAILARTRALYKKADKVGLHFNLDLSFRYETACVIIYENGEGGKGLGDRVFDAPHNHLGPTYNSITMGHINKYLDEAEAFIEKYAYDKEHNLEKKVANLSAELTDARKALRKVKNANKKKSEEGK